MHVIILLHQKLALPFSSSSSSSPNNKVLVFRGGPAAVMEDRVPSANCWAVPPHNIKSHGLSWASVLCLCVLLIQTSVRDRRKHFGWNDNCDKKNSTSCLNLWPRACHDCHPAAPAMLCKLPVCRTQQGEGAVCRDKGELTLGESKLLIVPSHESHRLFQGHTVECNTLQPAT